MAAKIWKERSVVMDMDDERVSKMLFRVDCRKSVVPQAPIGFSGNALIPGFARASVKELKEEEDCVLVEKVKEGLERLDDEYARSSMDWLEVNIGLPCRKDSFSLMEWWRLGLEEDEFIWSKVPVSLKPGLVYLLPGPTGDQIREFHRLTMEG